MVHQLDSYAALRCDGYLIKGFSQLQLNALFVLYHLITAQQLDQLILVLPFVEVDATFDKFFDKFIFGVT